MALTPAQIAEKWSRRAQGAASDYTQGCLETTKNPMALAAAAKDRCKARFNEAIDSGKWEDGLMSVSPEVWKRMVREKGSSNYSRGIGSALEKSTRFWTDFLPFHESVKSQIDSLPATTDAEKQFRMNENYRLRREYRRRRSRR